MGNENPSIRKARQKRYYEANKAKCHASSKEWRLANFYGITPTQYLQMKEDQEDGCAICGRVPGEDEPELAVDHCHKTKAVRGLLCRPCNQSLGKMGDDPARLRQAADYLEGIGTYE